MSVKSRFRIHRTHKTMSAHLQSLIRCLLFAKIVSKVIFFSWKILNFPSKAIYGFWIFPARAYHIFRI